MGETIGRIKLDSAGMQAILDGQVGGVDAALQADASAIASAARRLAPVDSGAYQASIRVERGRIHLSGRDRLAYQVIADEPHAIHVERQASTLAKALGSTSGRLGRGSARRQ